MENNKINVKLLEFEDKTAKSGKNYTRFKTNEGWMSAFELPIIEELKKHMNHIVEVEIATNKDNKWRNIRKFVGIGVPEIPLKVTENKINEFKGTNKNGTDRNCELMTAKDIFCKLLFCKVLDNKLDNNSPPDTESKDKVMGTAIALVKQAREAFE